MTFRPSCESEIQVVTLSTFFGRVGRVSASSCANALSIAVSSCALEGAIASFTAVLATTPATIAAKIGATSNTARLIQDGFCPFGSSMSFRGLPSSRDMADRGAGRFRALDCRTGGGKIDEPAAFQSSKPSFQTNTARQSDKAPRYLRSSSRLTGPLVSPRST